MITELPMFLRQYEVAKLLQRNKRVVQRAQERGRLTPIREGREVLYRREEVLGFIETRNNK